MTASVAPPGTLLEASGLTLSRGGRTLFTDLSLTLAPGETLLVKGPNGAGKSSLLLALAGVLRPETGTIRRAGAEDAATLHYVGHASGIKTRLTLGENLHFWQAVNGLGAGIEAALDEGGLGGLADIEAGHLSAGQTRRLALARLRISTRPIWLLDEPTASLDAAGHELVGRLLAAHTATGGGAIVATHDDIPGTAGATILALGAA